MKTKNLSKKLAENLGYFVGADKRCRTDEGCFYSGKTINKDTKGCFIGALLPQKTRDWADNLNQSDGSSVDVLIILAESCDIKLPKIITENRILMGQFQELHDSCSNWSDNVLSSDGKRMLKGIIKNNDLDREPFEKFL